MVARFGSRASGVGAEVVKANRILHHGGMLSIAYDRGGVPWQLDIKVQ